MMVTTIIYGILIFVLFMWTIYLYGQFASLWIEIQNKKPPLDFVRYISNSKYELNRNFPTDAGMDICSNENYLIPAHERQLVSTGIQAIIPDGHAIIVKPRSGLAVKNGIDVGAGVCDESYTGEIKVLLFNHSDRDFEIRAGDRIAQLLLVQVNTSKPERINQLFFNTLKDRKDRQDNGFGSSGK